MNKTELAAKVAVATGETNKKAADILAAGFQIIAVALAEGEEVRLNDFGFLKVAERPARVGRNPQTGEKVDIPAKRVVKFKPATALKAMIEAEGPPKKAKRVKGK